MRSDAEVELDKTRQLLETVDRRYQGVVRDLRDVALALNCPMNTQALLDRVLQLAQLERDVQDAVYQTRQKKLNVYQFFVEVATVSDKLPPSQYCRHAPRGTLVVPDMENRE